MHVHAVHYVHVTDDLLNWLYIMYILIGLKHVQHVHAEFNFYLLQRRDPDLNGHITSNDLVKLG